MKIGKIILFVVLLTGLLLWVLLKQEALKKDAENTEPQQTPAQKAAASADKALLDTVLNSPESLGEAAEIPGVAPGRTVSIPAALAAVTLPSSQRLSSVEKPPLPQPLKEPVAAETLYFHKDYASLRKDEIRNPDSAENRAGVVSLLQARQRRTEQQGL